MQRLIQEQDRLTTLDAYDVLDTPAEESFDRITRLVRTVLGVPMAGISLIDAHRQWFKSRQGLGACELPRSEAFCEIVIRSTEPLVIADTLADALTAQHPAVIGGMRVRFYAGAPLYAPDGQAIGTLCGFDTVPHEVTDGQIAALVDLSHIVMDQLELRRLARVDALTGALSRRGFKEEAGRAITLAHRHRYPLAGVMFDLDHFKRINTEHGHWYGDAALTATVATARAKLRNSDLIGRVGGEEFAIILPHTDTVSAMKVSEKLRRAIAKQEIAGAGSPITVTASFGLAPLMPGDDVDALLRRADAALHNAKEEGRNRSVAHAQPEPAPVAEVRRRVLKAGQISFNGGHSAIDCTVRRLSETGAGIDVNSTTGVPDRFQLRIDADRFIRPARVLKKSDTHVEVAFEPGGADHIRPGGSSGPPGT